MEAKDLKLYQQSLVMLMEEIIEKNSLETIKKINETADKVDQILNIIQQQYKETSNE